MINERGALEQLPYESQTPQRHQQTTHPGGTISHSRCGSQNIGTGFEIPDHQELRQPVICAGGRVITPCYTSGSVQGQKAVHCHILVMFFFTHTLCRTRSRWPLLGVLVREGPNVDGITGFSDRMFLSTPHYNNLGITIPNILKIRLSVS